MKEKVIVFGKGIYFEKKREAIEYKYEIEAFLDNAIKPNSVEEKDGIKVYSPQNIDCYTGNTKILLASNKWFEMWKQLMELGIDEGRIVFGLEIMPFADMIEEILYDNHIMISCKNKILYIRSEKKEWKVLKEKEYKDVIRGFIVSGNPYIELISKMPLVPTSKRFGLERGTAIDRFYIEKFLEEHKEDIKGVVMEIAEKRYISMFPDNITKSVILHVNGWGEGVTKGNLVTGEGIEANSIDCLICTQTIQFIYDVHSVVKNIHRLLKPGGVAMITAAAIAQISLYDYKNWGEFWRFTDQSMKALLSEVFECDLIKVYSYGNMKAAIAFLFGLCQEEVNLADLEYQDDQFPMVIAAIVRKA